MLLGALSRRDLLLSALAVFIAWGYLVHWIPSLRWTVHCFVLGSLVSPCVILYYVLTTSRAPTYASNSSIVRPEGLAFLDVSCWQNEIRAMNKRRQCQRQHLYPASFLISTALDEILQLIERDFVQSWYSSISPNPIFIDRVDSTIRSALGNIRDRALSIDLTLVVTERIIPILTTHFRDFHNAERLVRGKRFDRNITETEELDLAIAAKFRDGKLHPAASLASSDMKLAQQKHVRNIIQQLLPKVLGNDVIGSRAVCVLIEEIVSCAILIPILQMLGDPDTWNQIIENYGQSILQDRSTVRRLRAALDEHATPSPRTRTTSTFPKLNSNDSERRFEKFVRSARKVNNISEARRFRSEVSSQLKRDADSQDTTYLRRLDIGKRVLDRRVEYLAGVTAEPSDSQTTSLSLGEMQDSSTGPDLDTGTLLDLLKDPAGLSFFMEYMDRQHMMPLVQFWLIVDGLRNPLEEDVTDDDNMPTTLSAWEDADRRDLAHIYEAYLLRPEVKTPELSNKDVQEFLKAGRAATPEQYFRARQAILHAQTSTLEEMNTRYYAGFKKSDLFYKCLTSREASSQRSAPRPAQSYDPSSEKHVSARPAVRHSSTADTLGNRSGNDFTPASRISSRNESSNESKDSTALRRSISSIAGFNSPKSKPAHKRQPSTLTSPIRKSFDLNRRNDSLFGSEDESDDQGLGNSIHSVDQTQDAEGNYTPDEKVVNAMEAALNDIMESKAKSNDFKEPLFDERISPAASLMSSSPQVIASPRQSSDLKRIDSIPREGKPNISSLGLVNTSSRIGVFTDDDLFPDEEKFIDDEHDNADSDKDIDVSDEIHEAAPGDLGLAEAITELTSDINRLTTQNLIIASLTRKAELTNNAAELRILRKSHASLLREIRRKESQRQQYVVQEANNSLYGRSTVRIHKIMVGKDDEKREFVLYLVEVLRKAGDQMPSATWTVQRRYSEFLDLHHHLRDRYPSVRHIDFPRRRAIMNFTNDFLQKRRVALENYLRELLLLPDVCRDRNLRSFLSQSNITVHQTNSPHQDRKDMIKRFYSSVQDGMGDMLGNMPALEQLSSAGQNLMSQLAPTNPQSQSGIDNVLMSAEAEAELAAFEDQAAQSFVKPICDIFLEIFELNRGNNWLRGRAVVVVLHQLLGGTVEKKFRESVKTMTTEEAVLKYISSLKGGLWDSSVGGVKRKEGRPRTEVEKAKSRREASVCLATLIPDLVSGVVGRSNAQAASRRILATLNNSRLNTHLVYTLLDEIIDVLFGKISTGT